METCAAVRGLFWPLSCDHFTEAYWEKRHHLTRNSSVLKNTGLAVGFPALLRAPDLSAMAEYWTFKVREDHSQAVMLRPNSFSHDVDTYPPGTLLTRALIRRALASNRTVVLHNVELYWRPIAVLTYALQRHFGVYSQANVYYSPPGLQAAVHAHQDAQSVFIVQCQGMKRWQLWSPPHRWRLRLNQRGKGGDVAPESELKEPLGRFDLQPGDVLFVPRGVYHSTSTIDSEVASLHVTVGVETDTDDWTWLSLLTEAAETILGDATLADATLADATPGGAAAKEHAKERLQSAQWRDESLREALPLSLCRPGGSLETDPFGDGWLAHAKGLWKQHVLADGAQAKLPHGFSKRLRRALDEGLRKRQDYVARKRRQLLDFFELSPTAAV